MPNPNKIIEGLNFLEYSSNMSDCWGGIKFPESIAADFLGGSHALFFSGRDADYRLLDTASFAGGGFGPRGLSGTHEPVSPLFGLDGPGTRIYGDFADGYTYISGTWAASDGSDPGVPLSSAVSNAWESGYTRWKPFSLNYLGHDQNTPKLFTKIGYVRGSSPTPRNTVNKYVSTYGATQRTDVSITSINTISALDILCEGPIEGLVSGNYIYDFSGKRAGDIGYTNINFEPFFTGENDLATNPIVGANAPEARSIFWNDTPIVNEKGYVNFQYINYKYNYGEPNLHTQWNPKVLLYEDRFHWDGYQVDKFKYPIPVQTSKQINEKIRGASTYEGAFSGLYYPMRYYIYNTDLDAIRLNFKIEALYFSPITGSNVGETEEQEIQMQIFLYRLYKDGTTSFASMEKLAEADPFMFSAESFRIRGKIQSPMIHHFTMYLRSHSDNLVFFEIEPNQVGWMIRVDKPTTEFYGAYQKNTIALESITQIYSERFTFPNTACVFSKYDSRYFSNVPERSYRARLLKVKIPSNYDPIAKNYNGNWDGTFKLAWTDNPAWCYYDLITSNRYGLGKFIDSNLVDKWTLYEVSKYCDTLIPDGMGGLEPRFTCNVLIGSKEEAYKVLDDMASIFNGLTYYSAGQIFVSQDSPKEPIYLFNNSNVVEGQFTYSDSSKRLRRSVALIRFNDSKNNYKPALEYVEDRSSLQKYGIREAEVTAFGCTRPNQARRLGKWFLKSENLETETVEFKVGLEGSFLKPGDVVSIFDQNRKNNIYAGRTLELTSGYAIIDSTTDNLAALTGSQRNNTIQFSVLTPSYTLEQGTEIGNLYMTGFDANSSGISGLNSMFFRKSQIQNISITNPKEYLTTGTENFKDFIKINFPNTYSIPEINGGGLSVSQNKFTKTAVDGWGNAHAYSATGYQKNIYTEATADSINKYVMFGLNSENGLADPSYTGMDYSWYFQINSGLGIYENGNNIGSYGSYTTSTKLKISYDGELVNYYKDGVLMRTVERPIGEKLYADSSFYSNGAAINWNYGKFSLSETARILPQNTVWTMEVSGYNTPLNARSQINNNAGLVYPGYYLEATLDKPKPYRVVNIQEIESKTFSITALEYVKEKYQDIETGASLVSVDNKVPIPGSPTLGLDIIYRNASGKYATPDAYINEQYVTSGASGVVYTSAQPNGINSIGFFIKPPANSGDVNRYLVYKNSGTTFLNDPPGQNLIIGIYSNEGLGRSGVAYSFNSGALLPSFFTPLGAGTYYVRVYAENVLGERSPYSEKNITLTAQSTINQSQIETFNVQ
jgi:hypothetical protein